MREPSAPVPRGELRGEDTSQMKCFDGHDSIGRVNPSNHRATCSHFRKPRFQPKAALPNWEQVRKCA